MTSVAEILDRAADRHHWLVVRLNGELWYQCSKCREMRPRPTNLIRGICRGEAARRARGDDA